MPGRSFMREFEDPFFADHREHINRMFENPFGGFPRGMGGMGMLEDGGGRNRGGNREGPSQALSPFDANFGFGSFGRIFQDMDKMMQDAHQGVMRTQQDGGNGQMYQQTSVMSYSNTGQGPPKVFQASQSSRSGPGGVRETRKALKDSERNLEKMAIGHHIRDRGHEVEKHRNTKTGQTDEFNNFVNLDDAEAEGFDQEWQEKTRQAFRGMELGDRRRDRRDEGRALPDSRQRALPPPRSEHWGGSRDDRRRDRS